MNLPTIARQARWEQKMFWRNPASASFTFAFPLMFLVIFIAINGNDHVDVGGGQGEVRPVLRAGDRLLRADLGVLHEPRLHPVHPPRERHPEAHPGHTAVAGRLPRRHRRQRRRHRARS